MIDEIIEALNELPLPQRLGVILAIVGVTCVVISIWAASGKLAATGVVLALSGMFVSLASL